MNFLPQKHSTTNPFPACEAYKAHGIRRSLIHNMMLNAFHISHDIVDASLSNYFVHHWTGRHLEQLLSANVSLWRDEIEYSVVFHKTTRWNAARAKEVAVSFRKAKEEYQLLPYVLVKVIKQ